MVQVQVQVQVQAQAQAQGRESAQAQEVALELVRGPGTAQGSVLALAQAMVTGKTTLAQERVL